MVTTQTLGVTRGFKKVIQGGAPDHEYYTQIRYVKNAVTVKPGFMVATNGEAAGTIDLAASGDGAAGAVEIVLERVAAPPQDIDTAIVGATGTPTFVKTLRPSGGRFIVAAIISDPSTNTEIGEPLVLDTTGHLKKFAYTDTAAATDTIIEGLWRCAEARTDVASTDLVQLIYF